MPENNFNNATLPSVINLAIDNRLKDMHTSMPGIIESFDAVKQIASVQPAVRRIFITLDGDLEILVPTDLPVLINVPVSFPRGGGFSLTFPVKKGDECQLIFCERSIDNWHTYGGVKKPTARRFHSLSDAIAYVGVSSLPNKVPNYSATDVQIKKDDDSVYITLADDETLTAYSTGKATVESAASAQVKAPTVDVDASTSATVTSPIVQVTATTSATITSPLITLDGAVVVTGALTAQSGLAVTGGGAAVTGTMTNNGTDIGENHTHPQGADSAGDTQVNTGAPV